MKEPLNGGSLESRRRSYKRTIAFFINDRFFYKGLLFYTKTYKLKSHGTT